MGPKLACTKVLIVIKILWNYWKYELIGEGVNEDTNFKWKLRDIRKGLYLRTFFKIFEHQTTMNFLRQP